MRLLRKRCAEPRATMIRPAERYLAAGANEARRLGHRYVGTEHVLLSLTSDPAGGAARVLQRLGVTHGDIAESPCLVGPPAPRIDADALATLGIDLDVVRERLEETFGPGALRQADADVLGIAPRLKQAFALAVDYAEGRALRDEDVLLGLLSVPDSLAAHMLSELGVSKEAAEELVRTGVR
jgi:ATP-dependent Clp protease ATP-binding subunit ClpA